MLSSGLKVGLLVVIAFGLSGLCIGDKQDKLLAAQKASSNGVIHFTATMFDEYASGKSRPYSVIFMLQAEHLMVKDHLKLKDLATEFYLVAKGYKEKFSAGPKAGKVFFATMEYKESAHIFERLGISALPIIFRMPGSAYIKRTGPIDLDAKETMTPKTYPNYPWSAEAIAGFIKSRTGLGVEAIPREVATASPLSSLLVLMTAGLMAVMGYNMYYSPLVQNQWVYVLGVTAICWFSTSGCMFNIIRGVGFEFPGSNGRGFFFHGAGYQLGGECFVVGTAYLTFSGMILVMKNIVTRLRSSAARRFLFYSALVIATMVFRQILGAYRGKTGYHIRHYLM